MTFDPVDLFPRDTVQLADVHLFTNVALAGAMLASEWTARSRDASGLLTGTVEVAVQASVLTIADVLAELGDDETGVEA